MTDNDTKCYLSEAYVKTVATMCGCGYQESSRHPDGMGIDARLEKTVYHNGEYFYSQINVQIKCIQVGSVNHKPSRDKKHLSFSLKYRLYNTYRSLQNPLPFLFILMVLPEDRKQWVDFEDDLMKLRQNTYWVCMRGAPKVAKTKETTIKIPTNNLFNEVSLSGIIELVKIDVEAVRYEG
jgi:hypothetical protein